MSEFEHMSDLRDRIESLESERDVLRAEMKRLTMQIEVISNSDKAWEKDATRWRALAEKMAEGLREISLGKGAFSRDPLEHCRNAVADMKTLALETVSLYDEAVKK